MGPPSGGRRRNDLRGPSRKLCQDYGRLPRPAPNAQSGLAIARPSLGGPQITLYQFYGEAANFADVDDMIFEALHTASPRSPGFRMFPHFGFPIDLSLFILFEHFSRFFKHF